MDFNDHSNLRDKHSFLSGSNSHWVNYNKEKLLAVYQNQKKKEEGTQLHALASMLIIRRIAVKKLKKAFNMFVNDAIGFNMHSEKVLYYSDNAFGTADAILFKDGLLRIFDLKTGISKVSFRQLDVYAAMFCLEYGYDPGLIIIEQRIYQGNEILVAEGDPINIQVIMNKIVEFDKLIEEVKYL